MNIKIFLCCHKSFSIVPPLCIPIQGGRAINLAVPGVMGDDCGDSISEKNREYCELTVQYYAWKNENLDYYGFCHYRRFFCFDESVRYPYLALGKLSEKQQKRFLGDLQTAERLCESFDMILPRSEDMGVTVKEHYCTSAHHHSEDLALFMDIIGEKAPHLLPFAEEYLPQTKQYFCNMFIMRRELFNEYCGLLFPLLEEFDRRKTPHGSFQDDRTDGYLGERFVGIFAAYCRTRGMKIKELPRLDISCAMKKRLMFKLFPPQSKRRFLAKKLVKTAHK